MSSNREIVFAPGCFDEFDGTQEELDQLVADIREAFSSGQFDAISQSMDLEDEEFDWPDTEIGVDTRH